MVTTALYLTGGTSLTIAFATYTMTPNCGYALSYSYSVDGVSNDLVTWLTFSSTNLNLVIYSTDTLNEGTYTVDVIAT